MTYRTIAGIRFRALSPALYELDGSDEHISLVTVALVGRMWYIDVLMAEGHSHHRGPYRTRDAACAAIAGHKMEASA